MRPVAQTSESNAASFLICRLYAICCCIFVLFLQTGLHRQMQAQNALHLQRILMENQKQQYQLSYETIQHINQKCHNLKHQVEALRAVSSSEQCNQYLDEIENSVMIYDAAVKTGNEVLDTVLTENSLICEREGIQYPSSKIHRLLHVSKNKEFPLDVQDYSITCDELPGLAVEVYEAN